MSRKTPNNNSKKIVVTTQKTEKVQQRPQPKKRRNNSNLVKESISKEITMPVSKGIRTKVQNPSFSGSPLEPIIKKCEFVKIITNTSTSFIVTDRLRLNPGSQATFPWLSTLAPSFEFYRFKKLHFHLITRQATTAVGSVLMSPDYDAADGAPSDEPTMAQYVDSVEAPVWSNQVIKLDSAKLNALYKRRPTMSDSRFSSTSQDAKTVDAGQLFIATDYPTANNSLIAKLWVDYEVQFMNPQAPYISPGQMGGMKLTCNGTISNLGPIGSNVVVSEADRTFFAPNQNVGTASNILGTFTKDWSGMVENLFTGTGLNPGWINANSVMNIQRNATSIPQTAMVTPCFQGTTFCSSSNFVNALAGDILSFTGGQTGVTSITTLASRFGSAFNSLN